MPALFHYIMGIQRIMVLLFGLPSHQTQRSIAPKNRTYYKENTFIFLFLFIYFLFSDIKLQPHWRGSSSIIWTKQKSVKNVRMSILYNCLKFKAQRYQKTYVLVIWGGHNGRGESFSCHLLWILKNMQVAY